MQPFTRSRQGWPARASFTDKIIKQPAFALLRQGKPKLRRPYCLSAPGRPSSSPPQRGSRSSLARKRGGMERQAAHHQSFRLAAGARLCVSALATRRSIAAIYDPGVRISWDEVLRPVQQAPCTASFCNAASRLASEARGIFTDKASHQSSVPIPPHAPSARR